MIVHRLFLKMTYLGILVLAVLLNDVVPSKGLLKECPHGTKRYNGRLECEPCPSGTFGYYCNRNCHCRNNPACDKVGGSCRHAGGCHPHWRSHKNRDDCQLEACAARFGPTCASICHCNLNKACDRVTGSCDRARGCSNGWRSAPGTSNCQLPCAEGTWGQRCQNQCRCKLASECNQEHGFCRRGGCARGYWASMKNYCWSECRRGTFGFNCAKRCHCKDPENCVKTTGVCLKGGCADGWTNFKGSKNCQKRVMGG